MPVGTKATIKTLSNKEIEEVSDGIILTNTYHLFLDPGKKILDDLKGVKNFMGYHSNMLTDSGGFQVFSLSKIRKITEEGVYFKHYKNGDDLFLSPELSILMQESIGSDIIMSFDECVDPNLSYEYIKNSVDRTSRWAKRGYLAHTTNSTLFGIIQGGLYKDLREKSYRDLEEIGFLGYSIGGLSVGETKEEMYEMTQYLNNIIDFNKPRYLMGVGGIDDIFYNVINGVDMFDCVNPTRIARHGSILTTDGKINIRNAKYKEDHSLIDSRISHSLSSYSKAYVSHLFREKEILASRIMSMQNLAFMKKLMTDIREAILNDSLLDLLEEYKKNTTYF
jgi:queuine tRNA-ribosyltransferase